MGKIKENLLTKGFSGRVGDEMVFRQVDGSTMVAKRRRKREVLTPKEQVVKDRFMDSVFYAKSVLGDPNAKAYYESAKKGLNLRSAYAAAVADYLKEPKVVRVNKDNYKGEVGNAFYIMAENNAKVFDMQIRILRADGPAPRLSSKTTGNTTRRQLTLISVEASSSSPPQIVRVKSHPSKVCFN